jgi:hypothetical protein
MKERIVHVPSPRTFVIRSSDIGRCPRHGMAAWHYREDGTCYCDQADEMRDRLAALLVERQAAEDSLTALVGEERWLLAQLGRRGAP